MREREETRGGWKKWNSSVNKVGNRIQKRSQGGWVGNIPAQTKQREKSWSCVIVWMHLCLWKSVLVALGMKSLSSCISSVSGRWQHNEPVPLNVKSGNPGEAHYWVRPLSRRWGNISYLTQGCPSPLSSSLSAIGSLKCSLETVVSTNNYVLAGESRSLITF